MELLFIFIALLAASLVSTLIKHRGSIEFISIVASGIVFFESINIALKVASLGVYSPLVFFSIDSLGAIILLIIGFIGFATTIYSLQYLRQETNSSIIGFKRVKQYFVLLNIFLGVMVLATTASNPIVTWISIEATTLSTAFLISFYNKPSAMEAAWKYLVISSVGLLLAFFGTLLYFTFVSSLGGNGFVSWQLLLANAPHLNPVIAKIAFAFILIGYGTKVGLAPMHSWLPDAHSKAPAPISALLSGVLLNVAFFTVLRFKIITDMSVGPLYSQQLLIIVGMISILIASVIILTQKSYKRLLAYSSIENMGVVALGFGFGGIGVFAGLLHIIYHSLIKSTLFLLSGNILLKYHSAKIKNVVGALSIIPVTAILFIIGFLAITGAPPWGIFLTKVLILSAGMKTYPFVSVIALFLMALLFIGFLKQVTAMVFGEKLADVEPGEMNIWLIISPLILISIALFLSLYIPPFLQKLLNDAVTNYSI